MTQEMTFRIYRGDAKGGKLVDYRIPVDEGMVVLDAVHLIQGKHAPDLACRWNCKAAKCGSCSAEINGHPRLMCRTRLDEFDPATPIVIHPLQSFPLIRDLVTDVSWNYEKYKSVAQLTPKEGTNWTFMQDDIDRVQEFRKCIQCFLCRDVCHVIRNHKREDFLGPAFFARIAGLEMHPIDDADRRKFLKEVAHIGYCNITKCCTEVCPEEIRITDNAIIPLKERVADQFYDPLKVLWRMFIPGT